MGNKLGWILAGVLLLGLIGYLVFTMVLPSPDRPTPATTRSGVLDLQGPKTPLADALGHEPTRDGNAGDDYAAAAAYYNQNQAQFEAMFERLNSAVDTTLEVTDLELGRQLLQKMAPAVHKKNLAYTFVHTPKELKVSAFADGKEDFEKLSRALQCLLEYYDREKQPAKGVEPAKAMFMMGWHLMNERARFDLVAAGMEYQEAAGLFLLKAYKETGQGDKLEAMENYLDELKRAHGRTTAKQRIMWTHNPKAGDIFNIIENDKDRTWRIEGTLALGILKFRQKGHRGNMRKMEKIWAEAQGSDDELLRAAAKVAKNCAKEQIER